ncbi:MAG: polysaccharide biosynthesis/export family protein [Candidatus Binatia bacterium]
MHDASVVSTRPVSSTTPSVDPAVLATIEKEGFADRDRLARLWQTRMQQHGSVDYPIGPGDLLEVNVAAVDELKDLSLRVSGEGTIALPFAGIIQASGLTEKELQVEIYNRLEKYMYNPQINLFVREYRSRQVAVIGAVEKPGLYTLASGADTILDMLSLAGGMKADAAPRINLIPAEVVGRHNVAGVASILPARLESGNLNAMMKGADPLVIDLQNMTKGGSQVYLSMPARPGDVIMVSGSGEVLVAGWVAKPASYKITPGLTVLGAINAAGGPHFAGDTHAVQLIRTGKNGEKISLLVDLEKIKHGDSKDIAVQEGDVIEVSSSTAKLVPYSFYHFVTTVFHAGLYY